MARVTVSPPATVKVQVNPQQSGSVQSINYGIRTIKGSTDLSLATAEDGDAVVYQANTNSFVVAPVSAKGITGIDAGQF